MNYRQIIPTYGEYARAQYGEFSSSERDNAKWREGQERYVRGTFDPMRRSCAILDLGCGDGVGIGVLKQMGFKDVVGVDGNEAKIGRARALGHEVRREDMHRLSFPTGTFDVVYCSHALEHAYWPYLAATEMRRVLRPDGLCLVVLPYPDTGRRYDDSRAHGAKYELGTNVEDGGTAVAEFFERIGLVVERKRFDSFREPEIWIDLRAAAQPV